MGAIEGVVVEVEDRFANRRGSCGEEGFRKAGANKDEIEGRWLN